MMVARKGPIADLLSQPLVVGLLMAFFAGSLGFVTGQATIEIRLALIETRVQALDAFAACATRHIDRLENGGAGPVPCELGVK